MHKALPLLACCALLAACSGSSPTGPSGRPTLSRTRFLAFGDSLTSGEISEPVAARASATGQTIGKLVIVPSASYPSLLQSRLASHYVAQSAAISVINAGRSQETAQIAVNRLPGVLNDNPQAEVLLLMHGVNGLFIAGPDLTADFVRDMVVLAKNRVRVFVGSMIPTLPGRRSSQVVFELEKLNSNLRSMAAAEGAVFVDLYTPMLPEAATLIGIDGLHPNEAGYRRISEIYFAAVQANLEVK